MQSSGLVLPVARTLACHQCAFEAAPTGRPLRMPNRRTHLDEARVLPRYRPDTSPLLTRHELERAQAAALAAALAHDETGRPFPTSQLPATKPGDPRVLRGIPAIGRSVTGAITGTSPDRVVRR